MRIDRSSVQNFSKKSYLAYIKLFPVIKQEKTKKYGMLILTFLTMIFFAIFAINPTLSTIAELERKLKDARHVDQELTKKIDNLGILQNKFEEISPDLGAIHAAIPHTPRAAIFLSQVYSIASRTGVQLQSVGTSGFPLTFSGPETGSFTFSVVVNGTYEEVDSFLTQFLQFERILTFTSLSMRKESVQSRGISASLQGAAYFLP